MQILFLLSFSISTFWTFWLALLCDTWLSPAYQIIGQLLTLLGVVVDVDMPIDSDPTTLLPFSQLSDVSITGLWIFLFEKLCESAVGERRWYLVQPRTFPSCRRKIYHRLNRIANLLQINSAFRKPMETTDTLFLISKCWEGLIQTSRQEAVNYGV